MKHINFDQSTVLREFARIADEKQLIKVAQGPADTGAGPRESYTFETQLMDLPTLSALAKTGKVSDGAALLRELNSSDFKRFKEQWARSPDQVSKAKLSALIQKVKPVIAQLQAQLKRMSPLHQKAYLPAVQEALALLSRSSVEEEGTVKKAAEKLYDVSGETGEDLVEQAHPGGGTATELTHSKTKENLVETIVEQQERDVEVARKAPKGTYAALVNLYNKLSKMGFDSKLSGLKDSITTVATSEEVVEHTLVTLADELDRLGYAKYADQVDELFKKKV